MKTRKKRKNYDFSSWEFDLPNFSNVVNDIGNTIVSEIFFPRDKTDEPRIFLPIEYYPRDGCSAGMEAEVTPSPDDIYLTLCVASCDHDMILKFSIEEMIDEVIEGHIVCGGPAEYRDKYEGTYGDKTPPGIPLLVDHFKEMIAKLEAPIYEDKL